MVQKHEDDLGTLIKTLEPECITHQSTWILVKEKPVIEQLRQVLGALMVRVTIKIFGQDESEMSVYDNTTITQFMQHLAEKSGKDLGDIKARAINVSNIRRIDNKIMNKKTNVENTLKDLDISDNTAILVEMRGGEEKVEEGEVLENSSHEVELPQEEQIETTQDIDKTPNLRSVLANSDLDPKDL